MKHERVVSIGPDHPALRGHFPGHPVVPGVLVMDEVIETLPGVLRASPGRHRASLGQTVVSASCRVNG